MVRMSEADVVAAFSDKRGGGSMKAARKAAKAGTGKDKTAASKPGAIGSGVGASRGLDPAAQAVLVGVTRSGKKGKTVTVVDGLDPGGPDAAKELVKKLKKVLGTGGSVAENGSMAFQGDNAAVLKDIRRDGIQKDATDRGPGPQMTVESCPLEARGEGRGRGRGREAVQTRGVIVITTVRVPSPSNVGGGENSRRKTKE